MSITEANAGSGIVGLDKVMRGGFPRGQFALIRGASGSGKTTLGLQFLMEGAQNGEPVLYLGTSETRPEIQRIADSHGWSMDRVTVHHHGSPPLGVQQTVLNPAELDLPETVETMLSIVKQYSPVRLVIDSLSEIRVLAREEMCYRRQLMAIKEFFSNNRCTVLLMENEMMQHSTLDSVVSTLIELEHTSPPYGPDRRRLRVCKIRGQDYSTGHHDYKIRRGGIEVFPRLNAADHRQPVSAEQISTGTLQMDTMLRGGLQRGTSTLLIGPSGTGKSLMVTQMLVAAAERGERAMFYVFDERIQTLIQKSDSVGLPLSRHVDDGMIEVRQIDPAELTIGEFSYIVQKQVEVDGIRMLAMDSLNGYAYAMPNDRLLGIYLHELSSFLNQQSVSSILTMTQHGQFFDRMQQPFDISYIADTVILFRHFEYAGQIRKAMSVFKCRTGPHDTSIREFNIDSNGLHVGEALTKFQGVLSGSPQFRSDLMNDLPGKELSEYE